VLAEVCIKLNKLNDAERALMTDAYYGKKTASSKEVQMIIPNGAAGMYLMGIICEKLVNFPYLEST
jgi:hypothetical protein